MVWISARAVGTKIAVIIELIVWSYHEISLDEYHF